MINISFTEFFTIEILNKYYSNQYLCNDFSIVPSARTAADLGRYNLVIKQYGNRFYAGIPADAQIPRLLPEEGMQFVFFMKCNNRAFFNFTNCPMGGRGGKFLYFTNNYAQPANPKLALSAPVTPYNTVGNYNTGDLVLDTGIVYEAVQNNTGGALTNAANWLTVDADSYVSTNDLMNVQRDPAQQAADPKDLTHFIPAADYAELLSAPGICGVISITNDSTLPNGFNLLMPAKTLPPPTAPRLFTICFLNRATKWKYILLPASTGSFLQTAPGGTLAFDGTSTANNVTSAFPLRFTDARSPFTFQLTTGTPPAKITPLPGACPDIIKHDSATNSLFTEIYLKY